jgi:translation elongation factor EF-1beta
MEKNRFDIGQSEDENQNQTEIAPNSPDIDMQKLAEHIYEKLRKELEIENERTGRS